MAFRTITARYDGTCRRCGGYFTAGERIRFGGRGRTYHLAEECGGVGNEMNDAEDGRDGTLMDVGYGPLRRVHVTYFPASGETVYRNARGRCEDAPCCGCCTY